MSPRFFAWVAQNAAQNSVRMQMFIVAAFVVAVYLSVSLWPAKLQPWGKAFIIDSGIVVYVIFFAFSIFTISLLVGFHW